MRSSDWSSDVCSSDLNVQGQFWFSKSSLGERNGLRLRVYGSRASIEWYQINPEEIIISFVDGRREIRDRASNVQVAQLNRYSSFKAGHPADRQRAGQGKSGTVRVDLGGRRHIN